MSARGRVVWINGAFGVGKMAVAERLRRRQPGAALSDPETLARNIRDALPVEKQPSDYQDIALWRRMCVQTIAGLAETNALVIVPMTLVHERYFDEIVGGLRDAGTDVRHFALTASPATIRWRLLKRQCSRPMSPSSTRWGLHRAQRCCDALASDAFRRHVPTDGLSAGAVADQVAHLAGLQGAHP